MRIAHWEQVHGSLWSRSENPDTTTVFPIRFSKPIWKVLRNCQKVSLSPNSLLNSLQFAVDKKISITIKFSKNLSITFLVIISFLRGHCRLNSWLVIIKQKYFHLNTCSINSRGMFWKEKSLMLLISIPKFSGSWKSFWGCFIKDIVGSRNIWGILSGLLHMVNSCNL